MLASRGRAATTVLFVAMLVAASLPLAAGMPARSKQRGERVAELRSRVERAGSARLAGETARAESLYLEIVEGADGATVPPLLLARAVDGLADLYRETGRWGEAETRYQQAAGLWEHLLGPQQPRLAVSLHNLASVRMARDDLRGAEAPLRRALAIFEGSFGADSNEARNSRRAYAELGRRLARE